MKKLDRIAFEVSEKWRLRPEDQKREMAFAIARKLLPLDLRKAFSGAATTRV